MNFARALMVIGIVIALVGAVIEFAPFRLGRLPGDLSFGGSTWRVYVPLGTSLLLSIVLTLVFGLVAMMASRR